jgi:tetratricopeptide (TPR) repeat protein
MMSQTGGALMAAMLVIAGSVAGCMGAEIEANNRQIQEQQAQIEKLQHDIEAMRQGGTYSTAPAAAGSCDSEVMRKATQRGGEEFAKGDFKQALGYYQDAETACPGNAEAELNLARTQEALGDRAAAINNYTNAANAGSSDPAIAKQAHDALQRLNTAR